MMSQRWQPACFSCMAAPHMFRRSSCSQNVALRQVDDTSPFRFDVHGEHLKAISQAGVRMVSRFATLCALGEWRLTAAAVGKALGDGHGLGGHRTRRSLLGRSASIRAGLRRCVEVLPWCLNLRVASSGVLLAYAMGRGAYIYARMQQCGDEGRHEATHGHALCWRHRSNVSLASKE